MRVWDKEDLIYDGLRALNWRRYLAAMWILCDDLRSFFADKHIDVEDRLMASTLELVREVVINGYPEQSVTKAAKLAATWADIYTERQDEVLGEVLNAWATFEGLCQEIAGKTGLYYASDWVTKAATQRWRIPTGRSRYVDRNEEIDDDSPMAQTLTLFEHIVTKIAVWQGTEWDPVNIRSQILQE
jgi:hypothetical protein